MNKLRFPSAPVVFAFVAALAAVSPGATPVINEFLAINPGPGLDNFAESSDWIEIRNPGPEAVDLAGWSLTDEPDIHDKWVFPSVVLNAGELLLVRASGRDLRDPLASLHANFTLSGSGEFLGLYSPAGVPSTVWQPYAKQFSGISFGTTFSGQAQGYFTVPTPGVDNDLAVLTGYVGDTRFSVGRGFFTAPFTVAIAVDTPGAVIRYTTDGSEPLEDSGMVYAGPVNIGTTTVLRARAFKSGMVPSNTDTQSYLFAAAWKSQPDFPPGFSRSWGNFNADFKVLADYGMNTPVTNDAVYGPLMIPAMTTTLPVLCVTGGAEDIFGDSGLHGNLRSITDSEVPVAVEFFNPRDAEDRFAARGALQIHGGAVREFAKKGFRLDFTGAFGDGPLEHPLFPGSPVESFDQLVLRPGGHDSFTVRTRGSNPDQNDHAFHASYLRDQFLRSTENAIGLISPRGRYVHLCINGLYWGVYDLHERPNAEFSAGYAGGDPSVWDVLHHNNVSSSLPPQVLDGDDTGWDALQALCAAPVTGDAQYQALAALLGPERFIDHLLLRMWAGDHDWLGPAYMPSSSQGTTADVAVYSAKNWYAMRDSRAASSGPWQFFTWDGEICMGNHLLFRFFDSLPTPAGLDFPHYRELNMDVTGISKANTPAAPWAALSAHPEFRLKVADRARKLLFNDGALTPAAASARIAALVQELELPMVAESARWGGVSGFNFIPIGGVIHRIWDNGLLTRDTHWRPEVAWLRDTFATQRGAILLNQLRARNLYPAVEPVTITPAGGQVAGDTPIVMSAPAGSIYYTIDGSDPRVAFSGAVAPGALLYSTPPVTGGVSPFVVRARAFDGAWSALTEIAFSGAVPPLPRSLAFTEIYYHPSALAPGEVAALGPIDPDEFEFIEITNVSALPVALGSLRFVAGIDFDFAVDATVRELAPGASLVLGANAAALSHRFGVVPAGLFANGKRLSNSGEPIKLVRSDGMVIADFDYNDRGDWPAAADGTGYSLHLLAPFSGTNPDPGENWRADGPSPGSLPGPLLYADWLRDHFTPAEIASGSGTGPNADPDGDRLENLIEFLTKSNPRRISVSPVRVSIPAAGKIRYTWDRRADAGGEFGIALQVSGSLNAWTNPPVTATLPTDRATVEVVQDIEVTGAASHFGRLRAAP